MSTAEMTARSFVPPSVGARLRWAISDTLTITRRNLIVWVRVPAYIAFTVIQPVLFVLMFRYVFGGAIPVNVPGGYVNFLMPGIIGQTAAFATFGTAIALAIELQKGVIDRLRSMPMARSAVLAGRLVADTGRMFITILIVVGVGYAVGFRFENGFGPAVAMVRRRSLMALHDGGRSATASAHAAARPRATPSSAPCREPFSTSASPTVTRSARAR